MKLKKLLSLTLCLVSVCLSFLIALPLVATAEELPGVEQLFSVDGVTLTKGATDGKTEDKGLLLTASEAGASASFKLDLSEPLHINLKTLNGSAPKFHIELTDIFGQTFSIHSEYKSSYDNLSVELDGKKGGIYDFSDKWDFAIGYTAAYNTKLETYTQFWRTYSKEDRNDAYNPVTADSDCLHLEFDPATMKVGIKRFEADPYLLIWDLSKETNDGHNIGSSIDCFGDYTFKIVFDDVENKNGNILVYSINGYDLSKDTLDADDNTASISAPIISNAVMGQEYTIPAATVKALDGSAAAPVASVNGSECTVFTPQSGNSFTVKYQSGEISREIQIPIVSNVTSSLDSADIPATAGVNQRIELPLDGITTNLSRYNVLLDGTVSVKDGENVNVNLENGSFVAEKAGIYTITYTALDGKFTKQFAVDVSSALVGINHQLFADVYRIGHNLTVNTPVIMKNGAAISAVTTVKFPSGKTADAGNVILDEAGNYEIVHSYTSSGAKTFIQSILVEEAAEDLFSGDSKVETSYGVVDGNNDFSGVKLSFNGNREVEYQKVIDLSDNRFDPETNTGDLLLELIAQPMSIGTADLEKIEIFFTDVNDESNVMSISLAYFPASHTITKVHAKGAGQTYSARRANGELTTVSDAGFNSRHSFIQTVRHDGTSISGEFENYTMKLYYDYEENALYGTPEWNASSYLILDFDDPSAFPTNPWAGFSDGKVKMSVKVSGVASTADIFVLSVDGSNFNDEYFTDTQAPIIQPSVDGNAPLAAVNTPYPLIPFDAVDLQSGISNVWWEVTNKNGTKLTLKNNTFTPKSTGAYTMTMFAEDFFGNVTTDTVKITVIPYVSGVVLDVNGDIPENVIYGQYVELPEYTVDGGAGLAKVTVTVTKDGKIIPVNNFKFFAEEEGTYTVTYKAEDYIGNTNYKSFFVNAALGTTPSIDESKISLPVAFIHGERYVFDDYKASFYAGAGATEELVGAKITVTDALGTRTLDGREYTPVIADGMNSVGSIKISLVFEKDGGLPLEIEREVPAVNPVAGQGYMADYFLVENGTANAYSESLVFTASSADDMTIKYIRAVNTRNLTLKFMTMGYVTERLSDSELAELRNALVGDGKAYATNEELDAALEEKNSDGEYIGVIYNGSKHYKSRRYYMRDLALELRNFGSFSVTMQDSLNPAEQVTVTYTKSGNQFISNICGRTAVTGANRNNEFFLRYSDETNTISDANNNKLGALTLNDAGKEFTGFTSGSVYITVKVNDISGDCAMIFKQINNHAFNDNTSDNITPVLWLNGTVDGRYKIGSTALIPTAGAFDILNAISTLDVTITAPDGTVLLSNAPADIEYKLTLGQYGTYMVVYKAEDSAGNIITTTKSLLVSDDRAPTLTFSGGIAASAKVGDTITLPTYIVNDDDTAGVIVDITFRKPNGQFEIVKDGTVKFDKAGRYTVNYFVVDADRNTTMYSYSIVVTE